MQELQEWIEDNILKVILGVSILNLLLTLFK
jgi:hypothetical protein